LAKRGRRLIGLKKVNWSGGLLDNNILT